MKKVGGERRHHALWKRGSESVSGSGLTAEVQDGGRRVVLADLDLATFLPAGALGGGSLKGPVDDVWLCFRQPGSSGGSVAILGIELPETHG